MKALLFTGNPEFEKLEYEISIKWIAAKNNEKKMGDVGDVPYIYRNFANHSKEISYQ